jgi:recombinational DNA repair protein RecR
VRLFISGFALAGEVRDLFALKMVKVFMGVYYVFRWGVNTLDRDKTLSIKGFQSFLQRCLGVYPVLKVNLNKRFNQNKKAAFFS